MRPWIIIADELLDIAMIIDDVLDTEVPMDVKWAIRNSDGTITYITKPNLAKILQIFDGKLLDLKNEVYNNFYTKSETDNLLLLTKNNAVLEADNYTDSKVTEINKVITDLSKIIDTLSFQLQSIISTGTVTTSTGSGAGMLIDMRTYTGDGNTTTYEVVHTHDYVEVFVNGILQTSGIDYQNDINKIIFTNPPAAGASITLFGYYFVEMPELATPATVITGSYTAIGGETELTIDFPYNGTGIITKNGLDITNDVVLSSGKITFNTPLDKGDLIRYYLFTSFKTIELDAIMPQLDPPEISAPGEVYLDYPNTFRILNYDKYARYSFTASIGTITDNRDGTFTYEVTGYPDGYGFELTVRIDKDGYRSNTSTYTSKVKDLNLNTGVSLINFDLLSNLAYSVGI